MGGVFWTWNGDKAMVVRSAACRAWMARFRFLVGRSPSMPVASRSVVGMRICVAEWAGDGGFGTRSVRFEAGFGVRKWTNVEISQLENLVRLRLVERLPGNGTGVLRAVIIAGRCWSAWEPAVMSGFFGAKRKQPSRLLAICAQKPSTAGTRN